MSADVMNTTEWQLREPTVAFFDVNETLSDMSAMGACFERVGAPADLAATWFAALLRDGFALAATDRMAPFADIGAHTLRDLLGRRPLNRGRDDAVEEVMAGFLDLDVHGDVRTGIPRLGELDIRLVTLSNGSASVAQGLLDRAGVLAHFERCLSVEEAGVWKPSRRAYLYGLATCGVEAAEALLIAVHPWDIDGAARAGLQTAWINRTGASYPAHFSKPTIEVRSLLDLADRLRPPDATPRVGHADVLR